ncbi:hypothetical protein NHX12_010784 [Muraenolepis orangiensis]|uniref:Uncharacterized protein n=1 Tax=Muraenolepis orangiensis TaxID=630683 RepID=A0A9Q0I870_9TELE|nr:hypothetical protein NHX12_010784 [Muraenolepis orangiensis]
MESVRTAFHAQLATVMDSLLAAAVCEIAKIWAELAHRGEEVCLLRGKLEHAERRLKVKGAGGSDAEGEPSAGEGDCYLRQQSTSGAVSHWDQGSRSADPRPLQEETSPPFLSISQSGAECSLAQPGDWLPGLGPGRGGVAAMETLQVEGRACSGPAGGGTGTDKACFRSGLGSGETSNEEDDSSFPFLDQEPENQNSNQNNLPNIHLMFGFETSVRKTPDEPSPPLPVSVRDSMRNNLKKKLNSIVDSLLKSAVSEITDALDASVFDHEMVMKEKIEELRIKLEKAEKKLRKRKRKQDVNHTSEQMIPEITVEVPDDWCAPLGCENVAVQTPSTSFMDKAQQSSSLGSLSVSLWLLPDIKQEIKKEVQHDGYQIDGSLSGEYCK